MVCQKGSDKLENIWAPWRYPWIKESSGGVSDCFLCDGLTRETTESNDRDSLILFRGSSCFVIMNRYPYSNGHLMIAPNRHINDPRSMKNEEWLEIGNFTQLCLQAMTEVMNPDGFNIGWNIGMVSGAGLEDHLHQHIVPRWNGDTNFMPVLGKAKVISQDLWESYDLLFSAIQKLINRHSD